MKDKDSQLIWEASRTPLHWSTRRGELEPPKGLKGVDCSASSCVHWSRGNQCIAESIELETKKDVDLGAVVICNTFLADDTGDEGEDEGEEDVSYEYEPPY